jgi:hypothetical protein
LVCKTQYDASNAAGGATTLPAPKPAGKHDLCAQDQKSNQGNAREYSSGTTEHASFVTETTYHSTSGTSYQFETAKPTGYRNPTCSTTKNLAAMCSPCNSGLSHETVHLKLLVVALKVRLENGRIVRNQQNKQTHKESEQP